MRENAALRFSGRAAGIDEIGYVAVDGAERSPFGIARGEESLVIHSPVRGGADADELDHADESGPDGIHCREITLFEEEDPSRTVNDLEGDLLDRKSTRLNSSH